MQKIISPLKVNDEFIKPAPINLETPPGYRNSNYAAPAPVKPLIMKAPSEFLSPTKRESLKLQSYILPAKKKKADEPTKFRDSAPPPTMREKKFDSII